MGRLWPRLEHRIIGVISPGPPTSPVAPGSDQFYPLGMAPRDYIVALRLTALWLDPQIDRQKALLDRFLNDTPSPVTYFGLSPDEFSTVTFVSSHGGQVPTFTIPGATLAVGNLTVLSGIRPPLKPYRPEINTERILATLDGSPGAISGLHPNLQSREAVKRD